MTLNPLELKPNNDYNKLYRWEDYHPGWRFITALEYIITENKYLKISEKYNYDELYFDICRANNWPLPNEIISKNDEVLDWFLDDAIKARNNNVLNYSFPIETFEYMSSIFPVRIERYKIISDKVSWRDNLTKEERYEASCQITAIFEKTVHEILREKSVSCPWHNTKFPPEKECLPNCYFPTFFEALFGITLNEYIAF